MIQSLTNADSSREVDSTISKKGQVTIPVEIRHYLGVGDGDRITFVVEDAGDVRVKPARYPTIASLRGAAGTLKTSLTWKETRRIAREDQLTKGADADRR